MTSTEISATAWADSATAYTSDATITSAVDCGYSHIALTAGALTVGNCRYPLGVA